MKYKESYINDIQAFNRSVLKAKGISTNVIINTSDKQKALRQRLVEEEANEVLQEYVLRPVNKQKLAKELCDLIYVAGGGIIENGFKVNYNENFISVANLKYECSEYFFNGLIEFAEISAKMNDIDIDRAFKLVHKSNMSKFRGAKFVNGKLQKGKNYKAPDLSYIK